MEGESLQRRWRCKRQLEGAEGEGETRGWMEDVAAEAASERIYTGGGGREGAAAEAKESS